MSTDKKTYLIISHEIKINKKLDPANKMILGEIEALSKLPKGCYASESHFADILNINRSAANKRLNTLEKDQYIFVKRIKKNKKIIGKQYNINMKKLVEENQANQNNIVIESSVENETLDPEVDSENLVEKKLVLLGDNDSSDKNEIVPTDPSDSSLEDVLIVPRVYFDSSEGNTIYTVTNTIKTTVNTTVDNTNKTQVKNNSAGMTLFEFKKSMILDSITELFNIASRGEEIYNRIRAEKDLKNLRGLVEKNENFEAIRNVIKKIIDLETQLK